ncbi:MAG: serine dehydratase beta chain [archaeon]
MASPPGIFDIMGPVMVGPSSSHTAGALRIGASVFAKIGDDLKRAHIVLYNSFADTGEGHGTVFAIVAGLLGLDTFNPKIKKSHDIAWLSGVEIDFERAYDESKHPNSTMIIAQKYSGETFVGYGESIGGGAITFKDLSVQRPTE